MEGTRSIPSSCKQLSLPEMTAIPGFVCCRGRSRGHERRGLPAIAAVWSHLFPGVSSSDGLSMGPAPAGPSIPSPPHSPFSPRSRGRCTPCLAGLTPARLPLPNRTETEKKVESDVGSPNVIRLSPAFRAEGSSGCSAARLLSAFRSITGRKVESNLPECVHFCFVLAAAGATRPGRPGLPPPRRYYPFRSASAGDTRLVLKLLLGQRAPGAIGFARS